MTNFIEKKASTSEEAIRLALAELQMDRDDVSIEVLDVGKKGFFGIGAAPARVRVTFEVKETAEEEPAAAPAAVPETPAAPTPTSQELAAINQKIAELLGAVQQHNILTISRETPPQSPGEIAEAYLTNLINGGEKK